MPQGNCEVSRLEFKTCDQKKHGGTPFWENTRNFIVAIFMFFHSLNWFLRDHQMSSLFSRFFNMLKPWNLRNVTCGGLQPEFPEPWDSPVSNLPLTSPRLGTGKGNSLQHIIIIIIKWKWLRYPNHCSDTPIFHCINWILIYPIIVHDIHYSPFNSPFNPYVSYLSYA